MTTLKFMAYGDYITRLVASSLKLKVLQITRKDKHQEVCEARQLIQWMILTIFKGKAKLREIADITGVKNHSTVLHSERIVNDRLAIDIKYRSKYIPIISKIDSIPIWLVRLNIIYYSFKRMIQAEQSDTIPF